MDQPIKAGIIIQRDERGDVETNVPRRVVYHSPTGFEYGYGGSGPADLALNIIEAILLEEGYEGERTDMYEGDCFRLSDQLHQDFKWGFLANLDKEAEHVLEYEELRDWIVMKVGPSFFNGGDL